MSHPADTGDHPTSHAGHPGSMPSAHPAHLNGIAALHASAFVLQGLIITRLLDLDSSDTTRLLAAFAAGGLVLAVLWRCMALPHWLDMSFGMAGVGSLGMYFGIWTDHQFGPISDVDTKLWTYSCMLSACNLAMFTLTRHAHHHRLADAGFLSMIIGGNAGMIAGMLLGKRLVNLFPAPPAPFEMLCRLLGMSVGMIAGMLLGYVALLGLYRIAKALSDREAG
jgi:hypothetical protein